MTWELYISQASPYSIKIAALMGYMGIDHEVKIQNLWTRFSVIKKLTGKTMVPILRRGQWAMNDSTEIARHLIEESPVPTLPRAREAELLCWLLEDFADEWVVRWQMVTRWGVDRDRRAVSELIGRELTGAVPVGSRALGERVGQVIQKSLRPYGLRQENDAALLASRERTLQALEAILSGGPAYLFEGYPTVADFAFFGPLGQFRRDPTGRECLEGYPAIQGYLDRMEAMAARPPEVAVVDCESRPIEELHPLFAEVMGTYWPSLIANFEAQEAGGRGREAVAPLIDGQSFRFRSSRYLVERLQEILGAVDEAYGKRDHLFGEFGLRMEHGLVHRIADLSETESGRRLLSEYRHLGLH